MFRHVVIGADDPEQARAFYDASFAALGIAPGRTDAKGRFAYEHDGTLFIVGKPIDGQPATHANGGTLGFNAPSADAVTAWHAAGLANGGTLCEGQPHKLTSIATGKELWIAYLRDPTGNKLCAVHEIAE